MALLKFDLTMNDKETIEIPFGAKDSELTGWEYTIPEDMEAIIKDGKVIVKKKESEDERIRKEIIDFICSKIDRGSVTKEQREKSNSWIAYLEKQKEQNSNTEEYSDFTIYHPLKNGKGEYECIPYSFYGSLTSFSENRDLIDFLHTCFYTKEECEEWIKKQKEQKEIVQWPNLSN